MLPPLIAGRKAFVMEDMICSSIDAVYSPLRKKKKEILGMYVKCEYETTSKCRRYTSNERLPMALAFHPDLGTPQPRSVSLFGSG